MPHISAFHEPHRLAAKYAAKTPETANKLAQAIRNIRANNIGKEKTVEDSILFVVNKNPKQDTFEISALVGNKNSNALRASLPVSEKDKVGEKIYNMILSFSEKFNTGKAAVVKQSKNSELFKNDEVARFYDITDAMIN